MYKNILSEINFVGSQPIEPANTPNRLFVSDRVGFSPDGIGGSDKPASGARLNAHHGKKGFYLTFGKRGMDLFLVVLALPVALPLVLVCALLLWLEGGNPFYRQQRLGLGGKNFSMLKLRSMVMNADEKLQSLLESDPVLREEWETTQKLRHDPRVTRLGLFLRRTSLDELPQLWNVLTGEMSLVGPRPMMPEQLEMYGEPSDYFAMRPGITGPWQVSTRNASSFAYRRTIDTRYRESVSFGSDLGLLFRTVGVVFYGTGC